MPPGHLPVRSYLAVARLSRACQPGMFSARAERLLMGLAARLPLGSITRVCTRRASGEVAATRQAEEKLQGADRNLEHALRSRPRNSAASVIKREESERRFRYTRRRLTGYALFMLDPLAPS